jgi:hypothetical protein
MYKILLLGEHDKGLSMPFHESTLSGRRIRRYISDVKLVCVLDNVKFYDGTPKVLSHICKGVDIVIALGRIAFNECKKQSIDAIYLPHPATRSWSGLQTLRTGLHLLSQL